MKNFLFVIMVAGVLARPFAMADVAKVDALVVDEVTGRPIEGVQVTGYFTVDIGSRAWQFSAKQGCVLDG